MKKLFVLLIWTLLSLTFVPTSVEASSSVSTDSHFSDWQNRPIEKWTTDKFTYHDVGLAADDQNVYLYVSMAPGNPGAYKVMQPSGYQISINNHIYDLTLHLNDKLWSLKPGEGGWFSADVWNRSTYQDTNLEHAGYILREKEADGRENDVMKVAIPLSTFGKDVNQSSIFKLKNPNLGGESEITAAGASTKPIVLAATSAVLAAGGLALHRRKTSRKVTNENENL